MAPGASQAHRRAVSPHKCVVSAALTTPLKATMTKASTQAATAPQALPFAASKAPSTSIRDKAQTIAAAGGPTATPARPTIAPTPDLSQQGERPCTATPYGVLYTDTAEYAHFEEMRRIRDAVLGLLSRMERVETTAPEFVAEIDALVGTLPGAYGRHLAETLGYIRRALCGDTEIRLARFLDALRNHGEHFASAASGSALHCPRPPDPLSVPAEETDLPEWEHRSRIHLVNGRRPTNH